MPGAQRLSAAPLPWIWLIRTLPNTDNLGNNETATRDEQSHDLRLYSTKTYYTQKNNEFPTILRLRQPRVTEKLFQKYSRRFASIIAIPTLSLHAGEVRAYLSSFDAWYDRRVLR